MRDRQKRAKASARDKAAEREAERKRRDSLEEWLMEQPCIRIDGMGRPFRPGS